MIIKVDRCPKSKVQSLQSVGNSFWLKSYLHRPWTLDLGLWTLDLGLWTLDLGLWTLDFGLWTSTPTPRPPLRSFRATGSRAISGSRNASPTNHPVRLVALNLQ